MEIFTSAGLLALLQVIVIDLVLAGDNAVVIGLAAAGLPAEQRRKAILVGILAATVLRIALASVTVQLLEIIGLLLAGGLLLLWVCWKMWREIRAGGSDEGLSRARGRPIRRREKTFLQAAIQIVIADVSMSLDNVLAVAGAAREHPTDPRLRPRPFDRADGHRRELHRPAAQPLPLDRLCRSCHHPLCRAQHDLSRRARSLATSGAGRPRHRGLTVIG